MPYLEGTEPSLKIAAQKVHTCFKPFNANAEQYALAVANASASCKQETNRFWKSIQKLTASKPVKNEAHFVMEQNALVALNGERYYSSMTSSSAESWNIRDNHMSNTLKRLMEFYGPSAKAIVWEHNTHVGDARYTDMAREGMVNVGQLARKEFGENNVFIVGFGTYTGSVIAAKEWGAPFQKMQVPEATQGSWEQILHQLSPSNKIVLSKEIEGDKYFKRPVDHRAIGVVYRPDQVQFGYYVPTILPKRYDAFIYIDKTTALNPIPINVKANEPPDLYPFAK
jgi:erythromycin esterase-like protein